MGLKILLALLFALPLSAQNLPVVGAWPDQQTIIAGQPFSFWAWRTGDLSKPLTIVFYAGNSADPRTDYSPRLSPRYPGFGSLTFQPGQSSIRIPMQSLKSGRHNPVLYFQFRIEANPNYFIGSPDSAIVGIWK